ncbi:MAG: enoyl-CoA hydratase/isomerase family protein, partial [Alphaproteobacteria bacterium]|nr:enoyl-CoA hydratase/isomerase family protein [Alphaproteobacteria bacterium]
MEIRVETPRPHIALVTIANEPKRNAMTRAMLADLAALWDRLDQDADCRCVVLTGAGDKAFSAGADIGG